MTTTNHATPSADPQSSLRPLAARLHSLYESLPAGALRHAARQQRRAAGRGYRLATGGYTQAPLLPDQSIQSIQVKRDKRPKAAAKAEAAAAVAARISDGREIDVVERIAQAVEIAGKNRLNWRDSDIRDMSQALAEKAGGYIGWTDDQVIRVARGWVKAPFTVPGRTAAIQRRRLMDPRFWRRTLRRILWRAAETAHLAAGLVKKTGMQQVSDYSVRIRDGMLKSQQDWLAASSVERITEDGELLSFSLADLAAKKEKEREAEFWCWTAAFQSMAEAAGLEMAMLTLTLEPRFHPGSSSWDGTTPDAAHDEIVNRWAIIRAGLAQKGIALSGFRVVEAHKDGCPHWHLLLAFQPAARAEILAETIKQFPGKIAVRTRDAATKTKKDVKVFFDDAASCAGAGRAPAYGNEGTQAELAIINTAVGGLVTYMTKYLKKQSKSNDRAGAWRGCWGVRGMQWFGMRNALTGWRELRRLEDYPGSGVGRALWNRARDSDAVGFLTLLGGLAAAPVPAAARIEGSYRGATNGYDEPVKKLQGVRVIDLQAQQSETVVTRLHTWTLKTVWPKKANENNSITVIPSYPSKGKGVKSKPKSQPKTHKTEVVGTKPTPTPPDLRHYRGQNAASYPSP